MTRASIAFLAFALFCAVASAASSSDYDAKEVKPKCDTGSKKSCRFTFCDDNKLVVAGKKSDRALTAAICSKDGAKIGSVDETGEAQLVNEHRIPISKWKPHGLKQHFARSFFKAYKKHDENHSGVGHEVAQQNQAKFLDGKCWILPLKSYQVWNKKTNGWKEHYGTDPYVDCISFCTKKKTHYH